MSTTVTVTPLLATAQNQQLHMAQPMWKIVLNQFMEHRLAVVSSVIILLLVAVALCANLISTITGLDPNQQNVSARYLLPFSRAEAPLDFREYEIEKWVQHNTDLAAKLSQGLIAQGVVSGSEADTIYIFGEKTARERAEALSEVLKKDSGLKESILSYQQATKNFSTLHILGTDEIGRDVFIRLIYGARVSMGVGVMVAVASAMIGLLIGSLAGFYGGAIDTLLMRVTDALLSLPLVPVLIVISAIDLQKLPMIKSLMSPDNESIIKMFFILCLFSWMTVARLVRGSILSLREREFVLAAQTLGAKDSTIILRHMFPNVMAPMLVSITLGVGESILFEAALSFLGLGIMPPTASWGNMLTNAQEVIYKNAWLTILPGIMIFLTTVCFNFIGDGLQNAVDPKAIRR